MIHVAQKMKEGPGIKFRGPTIRARSHDGTNLKTPKFNKKKV